MASSVTSAPLLSLVEPAHAGVLEERFQAVLLEPGQVLFEEGRPCNSLWVLGPGVEVTVSRAGEAPGQVVLAHLGAGDTVGEMALVDEGPRSGTARVLVGGPASVLAAQDFYALRDAYHPAAFQLLRKVCLDLCARLRGSSERLAATALGQSGAAAPLAIARTRPEELEELATFRTLPSVVKLALAQKLGRLDAEGGTTVCTEGDAGDAAYFIASGAVQVQRGGYPLARLEAGEVFGMVALMDGGPRSASCVTDGSTRLFRLARVDFEQLFSSGNRFAFQLVEGMARQLVRNVRAADLLLARPERSARPLAVSSADFFSEAELAALDFGEVPDAPRPLPAA